VTELPLTTSNPFVRRFAPHSLSIDAVFPYHQTPGGKPFSPAIDIARNFKKMLQKDEDFAPFIGLRRTMPHNWD
jgi:hypothetical protein